MCDPGHMYVNRFIVYSRLFVQMAGIKLNYDLQSTKIIGFTSTYDWDQFELSHICDTGHQRFMWLEK